jgi:HPt (histidine-containing phosphotransfer) domain-containing protein
MIDRKKFDDTFQYYDKEVITRIIDLFEKELPQRLERIQTSIAERDYEAIEFNAHSLKSVSGTFIAIEPFELARTLEQMAKQRTNQSYQETFDKLKISTEELLEELLEIKARINSQEVPK